MHGGEIRRECRDMMIVLPRVISECFDSQFPARPGEIKRMFQEVFPGDVLVNFIQISVHDVGGWVVSHRFTPIFAEAKTECAICVLPSKCRLRFARSAK